MQSLSPSRSPSPKIISLSSQAEELSRELDIPLDQALALALNLNDSTTPNDHLDDEKLARAIEKSELDQKIGHQQSVDMDANLAAALQALEEEAFDLEVLQKQRDEESDAALSLLIAQELPEESGFPASEESLVSILDESITEYDCLESRLYLCDAEKKPTPCLLFGFYQTPYLLGALKYQTVVSGERIVLPAVLSALNPTNKPMEVGFVVQEFPFKSSQYKKGSINLVTHPWIHETQINRDKLKVNVSTAVPMAYATTLPQQNQQIQGGDLGLGLKALGVHTHDLAYSPDNAKITLLGNAPFYSLWTVVEKEGILRTTLHWLLFDESIQGYNGEFQPDPVGTMTQLLEWTDGRATPDAVDELKNCFVIL